MATRSLVRNLRLDRMGDHQARAIVAKAEVVVEAVSPVALGPK